MTAPVGSTGGILNTGDILYSQLVGSLADGYDLNTVWQEFHDLLTVWNTETTNITDLLSFKTTLPAEAIPNGLATDSFDEASEVGVPTAAGVPGEAILAGYQYKDYDKATRYTWKFLRDADVRQVRAVMDNILRLDQKLTNGLVFKSLFDNKRKRNELGAPVYDLYDGVAPGPPAHMGRTFLETESHYIASGAATLDSGDIEDAIKLIVRKGFGTQANSQLLIFANPDEAETIMSWRAGEESRDDGPLARYSFIPAVGSAPFLT